MAYDAMIAARDATNRILCEQKQHRPRPRRSLWRACSPLRRRKMDDLTSITSDSLIAAEKVNGTNVYNLQGEELGSVEDVLIDKVSGRAVYAIMAFEGFLQGNTRKRQALAVQSISF